MDAKQKKVFHWSIVALVGLAGLVYLGFSHNSRSKVDSRDSRDDCLDRLKGSFSHNSRSKVDSRDSRDDCLDRLKGRRHFYVPRNPCDDYPDEPACRKARENPDENIIPELCFYGGSPCDEGDGLEPIVVRIQCSNEPWFNMIAEDYPPQKVKGFDSKGTFDAKNFSVDTFHAMVAAMSHANGANFLPANIPLPHELDSGEKQALATGIGMYNQLVDRTPHWLAKRAERIEHECAALPKDSKFKPARCLPFEVRHCTDPDDSEIEDFEDAGKAAEPSPECMATLKLLYLNGIKVQIGKLPECASALVPPTSTTPASIAPSPDDAGTDAGTDAETEADENPRGRPRDPTPLYSRPPENFNPFFYGVNTP